MPALAHFAGELTDSESGQRPGVIGAVVMAIMGAAAVNGGT